MAMLHQNLAREVVQAYLVYALLAVWREIDDELKAKLNAALKELKERFVAEHVKTAAAKV